MLGCWVMHHDGTQPNRRIRVRRIDVSGLDVGLCIEHG